MGPMNLYHAALTLALTCCMTQTDDRGDGPREGRQPMIGQLVVCEVHAECLDDTFDSVRDICNLPGRVYEAIDAMVAEVHAEIGCPVEADVTYHCVGSRPVPEICYTWD